MTAKKQWRLLVDYKLGSFRYHFAEDAVLTGLLSKLEAYCRSGLVKGFELQMVADGGRLEWDVKRAAADIGRLAEEGIL